MVIGLISAPRASVYAADPAADELARAVAQAAGLSAWPKVKELSFTFNLEAEGKLVISAKHVWSIAAGQDTVTWEGQTITVNVQGGPPAEELAKKAFQRWTNDSYWLLMPLKLLDPGVNRKSLGRVTRDGKEYMGLELSFGEVGLTPGDVYTLYIDDKTKRVVAWEHSPKPGTKRPATWENYTTVGGLTLATERKLADGRRLFFSDLSIKE